MISFFVPGIPAPGGSKRHVGNGILIDAGKNNKPWRAMVGLYAQQAMGGKPPSAKPLMVEVKFYMPRPQAHYRKDGTVKPNAPTWHTKRPDATKLWRAAEDAMTAIVWADDSQIGHQIISKVYGEKPGVQITITEIAP